ncbi:hypothetical protein CVT25_002030 [Psilocybe cyanescens]|uniref:Uncharacterized protein n=1 Tax=Psilocybe cyanescens TaxID=93625 RepID=A0A409X0A4_PSICY|nr:hypothetical protein CVT25_002030 [Psilocybe cyanescens]
MGEDEDDGQIASSSSSSSWIMAARPLDSMPMFDAMNNDVPQLEPSLHLPGFAHHTSNMNSNAAAGAGIATTSADTGSSGFVEDQSQSHWEPFLESFEASGSSAGSSSSSSSSIMADGGDALKHHQRLLQ